jgi:hypothetical protein
MTGVVFRLVFVAILLAAAGGRNRRGTRESRE